MKYEKNILEYEGKAKKIYSIKTFTNKVYIEFKNDLTAFNGEKKTQFPQKGFYNKNITSLVFRYLESRGFKTHFLEDDEDVFIVCKRAMIVSLEVVVRNITAGSTANRLGLKIGEQLKKPLLEFYYKNDNYKDPFINDEHVFVLKLLKSEKELNTIKQRALDINKHLIDFFNFANIKLVDFKLEFGFDENGNLLLCDEVSPDTCRLWDKKTNFILDKDRFRNNLGKVKESYEDVWNRLQEKWEDLL